MKTIVIVALLAAAAGCGGKKSGSDCEAAIAKGMENASKVIKERMAPQIAERNMGVMDKVKGVLVERCKADGWPPEVVSCFTTVSGIRDMQVCQGKLTSEQASKLTADLSKVMTGLGAMRMGEHMPPGMPGHPESLQGAGAAPGSPPAAKPPAGSPDTPAAPAAAPSAAPAAPAGTAAPAGGAEPAAGGSASK
jgi:hypothetical protein